MEGVPLHENPALLLKTYLLEAIEPVQKSISSEKMIASMLQDNHPIALVSPKVIWQKVDYIHQNPVRAGWVNKAEEYLYSSARNYVFENEGCLLELDLLEPYLPGSSFVYLPGFDDQL